MVSLIRTTKKKDFRVHREENMGRPGNVVPESTMNTLPETYWEES